MLRKIAVLVTVLLAVGALAVPSVAAGWQHNHSLLTQNVQLGITGSMRFQGALGGIECQVTSRILFAAGTTGVVETFVPHPTSETANCKGLGGLAFCQIHNLTPQSAAFWTLHTQAFQTPQGAKETHENAVVVTTGLIHSQATGGFCPVKTISLTPAGGLGIVAEPLESTTISSVQLAGALQGHLTTLSGVVDTEQVFIGGTLLIEDPAQRNTYGF